MGVARQLFGTGWSLLSRGSAAELAQCDRTAAAADARPGVAAALVAEWRGICTTVGRAGDPGWAYIGAAAAGATGVPASDSNRAHRWQLVALLERAGVARSHFQRLLCLHLAQRAPQQNSILKKPKALILRRM